MRCHSKINKLGDALIRNKFKDQAKIINKINENVKDIIIFTTKIEK